MRSTIFHLAFFAACAAASPILTTSAAAQADVTLFGSPCSTPQGTPTMSTVGLPQLGTSMDFVYSGPNRLFSSDQQMTQPYLLLGFDLVGPIVIPVGVFLGQPAGCAIQPSSDFVLPMPPMPSPTATMFENRFTLPISSDPALLGFTFLTQWLAVNIQCGFAGCNILDYIATSETAICTVGL